MKKYLKVKELNESVAKQPTSDDCPVCSQHFYGSSVARESHMKLYPKHFGGESIQEIIDHVRNEAVLTEDLEGKVSHAKKDSDKT